MAGNSAEIEAGRAFVKLSTKDSEFEKGLKKASGRLKAFGGIVAGIGAGIGGMGGVMLAPLLASLGTFVERGSEIQHTSDRLGISAEAVQTLGAAAKASGADMDTLGRAFFKFNRETGKGLDEFVAEIDALPGKTNAAAAAFDKFGRHGLEVLQVSRHFANQGGVGKFMEGKKATVLSSEDVENAEKLHGALNSILGLPKAISLQLGAALGEQLVPFVDGVKNAIKYVTLFVKENRQIAVVVAAIGGALVAAGAVIGGFGAAIAAVGVALPFVVVGLKVLVVTVAAVAGIAMQGYIAWKVLTALMDAFPETAAAVRQWLGQLVEGFLLLWARVKETWSGIAAAMKTGDWRAAVQIAWLEIQAEFWRGIKYVHHAWAYFIDGLKEGVSAWVAVFKAAWDYVTSADSFEDAFKKRMKEAAAKIDVHMKQRADRDSRYDDKVGKLDKEKQALIDEAKRKAGLKALPKAVETLQHGPMNVADLAQGTFSSQALAQSFGVAAAKVSERIAKAGEATAQNTKDISDKLDDSGLTVD